MLLGSYLLMKQYLFYQHNVQQFFLTHRDKYAGIIAPLSIATSYHDGTRGFFQALLAKDANKEFLIDPRSALFQHGWDRKNIRDAHKKMAAAFGEPFTTRGLNGPLQPDHLAANEIQAITHACIKYQQDFRLGTNDQRKIEKYKKLAGINVVSQIQNPQLFIPPYFEFDAISDDWYDISLAAIEYAKEKAEVEKIRPVLHFSKFNGQDWKVPAKQLHDLGVRSVFLYPNYFREHDQSQETLKQYINAARAFAELKIEPYALHGGYFSAMLWHFGLRGFGNGVGYGEWRDSGYHRGGTAEKRIYIPKIHRFLEPAKAQQLLDRDPSFFSEGAKLISECVKNQRPLDKVSLAEALEHFMECRKLEMEFVESNSVDQLKAELSATIAVVENFAEIGKEYIDSLTAWRGAIS